MQGGSQHLIIAEDPPRLPTLVQIFEAAAEVSETDAYYENRQQLRLPPKVSSLHQTTRGAISSCFVVFHDPIVMLQ